MKNAVAYDTISRIDKCLANVMAFYTCLFSFMLLMSIITINLLSMNTIHDQRVVHIVDQYYPLTIFMDVSVDVRTNYIRTLGQIAAAASSFFYRGMAFNASR